MMGHTLILDVQFLHYGGFIVKKNMRFASLKADDDDVLLMLPGSINMLLTSWQGPFKVIK